MRVLGLGFLCLGAHVLGEEIIRGGEKCDYDWQCGFVTSQSTASRLEWTSTVGECTATDDDDGSSASGSASSRSGSMSGSALRGSLSKGRCECLTDTYYCDTCAVLEALDPETGEVTQHLTASLTGLEVDVCDYPSGGMECFVGACEYTESDSGIMTVDTCEGDSQCGNGVCIGQEGYYGQCGCYSGYVCGDCSMTYNYDVQSIGLPCGSYTSGGALCQDDSHCTGGKAGACNIPEDSNVPPKCECSLASSCGRCSANATALWDGTETCPCDPPVFHIGGVTTYGGDLTAPTKVYFKWELDSTPGCSLHYELGNSTETLLPDPTNSSAVADSYVMEEAGTYVFKAASIPHTSKGSLRMSEVVTYTYTLT